MAKDPSEMTDEELDAAIANPPAETEIPPVEVPVVEEPVVTPKEGEEPAPAPVVEPAPAEPVVEEPPVSRREQLRIQDVLSKLKAKEEVVPAPAPAPQGLDYAATLDGDPALLKKLEDDRTSVADAAYQRGIDQANSIRFHTRLEIDAPKMEEKFPQLDKTNEKFNPGIANAINTMFLNAAGYDVAKDTATHPNLRYAEYVEAWFELAEEIAGEKVASTTTNIKKQAAQTGIRPDGAATTKTLDLNKLPEQMTDEELDARIALAIPPSPRR